MNKLSIMSYIILLLSFVALFLSNGLLVTVDSIAGMRGFQEGLCWTSKQACNQLKFTDYIPFGIFFNSAVIMSFGFSLFFSFRRIIKLQKAQDNRV